MYALQYRFVRSAVVVVVVHICHAVCYCVLGKLRVDPPSSKYIFHAFHSLARLLLLLQTIFTAPLVYVFLMPVLPSRPSRLVLLMLSRVRAFPLCCRCRWVFALSYRCTVYANILFSTAENCAVARVCISICSTNSVSNTKVNVLILYFLI